MNWQSLARRVVYLLVLCALFGVVMFTPSGRKVKADDWPYSCDQQYGFCVYSCAGITDEEAYQECTAPCELSYNQCYADGDPTDPLPEPYPVIDNSRSACLQGCQACTQLLDPNDRLACYTPCWDYCNATYPKP
jgi:hypothetical protein